MEAFGLLLHGFAVLMTWKIITFRDRLIHKLYKLGLLEKPA